MMAHTRVAMPPNAQYDIAKSDELTSNLMVQTNLHDYEHQRKKHV